MQIGSILRVKGGEVISVAPEDTILETARILDRHRIGAVLVRDAAGALLGIISERDIIRGMAAHGPGTTSLAVAQFMTRLLLTVRPENSVAEALGLMTRSRVRHLPVTDAAGGLLGLVSIGDLVKARIDEAEGEAAALKDYVAASG